jgi:hypothetical protein
LYIFPSFVLAGGRVALAGTSCVAVLPQPTLLINLSRAGTHFQFLREIPMFARYEVRSQIVGWDHKWVRFTLSPASIPAHLLFFITQLYIVHRFVSHHKHASRRSAPAITNGPDSDQSLLDFDSIRLQHGPPG